MVVIISGGVSERRGVEGLNCLRDGDGFVLFRNRFNYIVFQFFSFSVFQFFSFSVFQFFSFSVFQFFSFSEIK